MKHLIISNLIIGLAFLVPAQSSAKIVRLLSIGNSFSEDAVEQYLYELCLEDGDTLIIGNAYQSGYSLKMHLDDVVAGISQIEYCKVLKGVRHITKKQNLLSILKDEPWDIITLQQVSQDAGDFSTYEPYMSSLMSFLKNNKTNSNAVFGFHMTWAYAKTAEHPGFVKYCNNQLKMYKSIAKAIKKMKLRHKDIAFVVPSGTAIQNVRTSPIGDNLNRDGFHLNYGVGRYAAACTWSEIITGKSCIGKRFAPAKVDVATKEIVQKCAHNAILKPYKVTKYK
ncbi:hypothetical protein HMPREF1870_00214 [Bacteroidales bacterium KA00344]|nr:hypothetical protein HMPREF1870_00214 [Bacteroidales bacterium KA00344]